MRELTDERDYKHECGTQMLQWRGRRVPVRMQHEEAGRQVHQGVCATESERDQGMWRLRAKLGEVRGAGRTPRVQVCRYGKQLRDGGGWAKEANGQVASRDEVLGVCPEGPETQIWRDLKGYVPAEHEDGLNCQLSLVFGESH